MSIEYEYLINSGGKLGIMRDKAEGMVKGVVPESIAEQQGLQEGDILTQIEGQILTEPFDLTYGL